MNVRAALGGECMVGLPTVIFDNSKTASGNSPIKFSRSKPLVEALLKMKKVSHELVLSALVNKYIPIVNEKHDEKFHAAVWKAIGKTKKHLYETNNAAVEWNFMEMLAKMLQLLIDVKKSAGENDVAFWFAYLRAKIVMDAKVGNTNEAWKKARELLESADMTGSAKI